MKISAAGLALVLFGLGAAPALAYEPSAYVCSIAPDGLDLTNGQEPLGIQILVGEGMLKIRFGSDAWSENGCAAPGMSCGFDDKGVFHADGGTTELSGQLTFDPLMGILKIGVSDQPDDRKITGVCQPAKR